MTSSKAALVRYDMDADENGRCREVPSGEPGLRGA